MKTRELIRQLQEADPDGEAEVTARGCDIYACEAQPSFYDGPHFVLAHDPERVGKSYSIVGGKINYEGRKVRLHLMNWYDVIEGNPDAVIELNPHREASWRPHIEAQRAEAKAMRAEVDAWHKEYERRKAAGEEQEPYRADPPTDVDRAEELYSVWRRAEDPSWEMLEPERHRAWVTLARHLAKGLMP